uniref:uncharacterized protein LOC122774755 isoform X2 n=1 Tax=Solea senegalensis TaxID=28829 RepID=UPI001CD8BE87|nr:uncharacterized protein LOC122774755 isoform X2 [Solea senegalensis]
MSGRCIIAGCQEVPVLCSPQLTVCASHIGCFLTQTQYNTGFSNWIVINGGSGQNVLAQTAPTLNPQPGVAVPCVAVQNTNNFPAVNTGNVTTVNTSSLPRVRHAATQTVPPSKRSVGIQLSMRKLKTNVRNAGTQATVVSKSRGVDTHTFSLDRLFLQPTLVKRPAKRPRLSISDKEEEEKDSPECS